MTEAIEEIERYIREVPDFPKRGISFRDITPLIEDGAAFHAAVDGMARATEDIDYERILSAEARGFVFGTALAYRAKKGLVLARKPNKLPRETISASYALEYAGGVVAGVAFLIELSFLKGRELLAPYEVTSLISYDDG